VFSVRHALRKKKHKHQACNTLHSDEQWAFHTECGICEVQAEAEGAVEY